MSTEETPKRWTAGRKAELVLELIKGTTTASEAARTHDLTIQQIEQWRDDFITQGTEVLRSHPRDMEAQWQAREKDLLAKIGDLTMEKEVLKKTHRILGRDLPEGIS